jgi:hypothetical protein
MIKTMQSKMLDAVQGVVEKSNKGIVNHGSKLELVTGPTLNGDTVIYVQPLGSMETAAAASYTFGLDKASFRFGFTPTERQNATAVAVVAYHDNLQLEAMLDRWRDALTNYLDNIRNDRKE